MKPLRKSVRENENRFRFVEAVDRLAGTERDFDLGRPMRSAFDHPRIQRRIGELISRAARRGQRR